MESGAKWTAFRHIDAKKWDAKSCLEINSHALPYPRCPQFDPRQSQVVLEQNLPL